MTLISTGIPRIAYYQISPVRTENVVVSLVSAILLSCFITVSFGLVTLVSLERFLAICYPIKHHLMKGTRRTFKLICCAWIMGLTSLTDLIFTDFTTSCIMWPQNDAYANFPTQITVLFLDDVVYYFMNIYATITYVLPVFGVDIYLDNPLLTVVQSIIKIQSKQGQQTAFLTSSSRPLRWLLLYIKGNVTKIRV
ncbi:uncharacterized protein [Amphiura filiformis]|uniref:uncharacterized protein n=1 Tax=Amphiura filiformis TaxID=82378 RepID=UPI003B20D3F8